MLKKVKKYSLFLVMTVFINILSIHSTKALEVGSVGGGGGGMNLEAGNGALYNMTNPNNYNVPNFSYMTDNPGMRVTVVDKDGKQVSGTIKYDFLTYEASASGNGVDWNVRLFNNFETNFENQYYISKNTLKKYTDDEENICWSFISGCKPTLSNDFYNLLINNVSLRDTAFRKLGLYDSNNNLKSAYVGKAQDYYLIVEPIVVYGVRQCVSNDANGTCNGWGQNWNQIQYWYGTVSQYINDNFNNVYGSLGTYSASKQFFTVDKNTVTNKFKMTNAAWNMISSNVYNGMVNIISLDDVLPGKVKEYKVDLVKASNGTCSTNKSGELTWKTKSSSAGKMTDQLANYNKKYGVDFATIGDCHLYCQQTIVATLPMQLKDKVQAPKEFDWIQDSENYKFQFVKKETCRLLPVGKVGEVGDEEYKKCLDITTETIKSTLFEEKTENKKNKNFNLNALLYLEYYYPTSLSSEDKKIFLLGSSTNTPNDSNGKYNVSENFDKCDNKEIATNDYKGRAECKRIIFKRTYDYSSSFKNNRIVNNYGDNNIIPDTKLGYDNSTHKVLIDKNNSNYTALSSTSKLYVPDLFENASVGYKSFNINIVFSRLGKKYQFIKLEDSPTYYNCKYNAKICYYDYKVSQNYNPAICNNKGKNNEGKYSSFSVKDTTTACNSVETVDMKNKKQYGNLLEEKIYIKNGKNYTCGLYCKETVTTIMPGDIYEKKSLSSTFEWIEKKSDYNNYKLKVKTSLNCRFLPSKSDTVETYKVCAENANSYLSNFSKDTNINSININDIDLKYTYQSNDTTRLSATFELNRQIESVNCKIGENDCNSSITLNCSNSSKCREDLAGKEIQIDIVDDFTLPDSPSLFVKTIDGSLTVDKTNPVDYSTSLYEKFNSGFLYVSKYSSLSFKYPLELIINSLGLNYNGFKFDNNNNQLNKTNIQVNYTCGYTPKKDTDCLCPKGTLHEYESPYDYMDETDKKQKYTCVEAQQKFCNLVENPQSKECIRESDGVLVKLDECLSENNTLEYCTEKECGNSVITNTYTCEYTKDGNKIKKDINSCVIGLKNSGKNEADAIKHCTSIDPDCCKDVGTCPKDNVIYRTIDLNNPFPGKDGSGRMPGSNWNSDTLIKNKITKTNDVYSKGPIYKITLTPSTIKKIREYNDKHDYLDYENLNCNDNGVACISSFLHGVSNETNKESAVVDVEGSCSNVTEYNFYTCLHYDDNTNNVY